VGEGKEALAYGRVAAAFLSEGTQGHALRAGSCRLDVPAWLKRSNEGCDYLSVKLDNPSLTALIYANWFDDADDWFSRRVVQTSSERRKPAAMPLRYRAGQ
jgi:uncharacterized protein (DUF736 family)